MSIEVHIDTSDLDKVITRIKRGETLLGRHIVRALMDSGAELAGYIKREKLSGQALKRQTGRLSRSIHAEPVQSDPAAGRYSVEVGTNVEYAAIHEFGGEINHPGSSLLQRWPNEGSFSFSPMTGKVTQKQGQFVTDIFARHTRPHKIKLPQRSFLRTAMADKRDWIDAHMRAAIQTALDEV